MEVAAGSGAHTTTGGDDGRIDVSGNRGSYSILGVDSVASTMM